MMFRVQASNPFTTQSANLSKANQARKTTSKFSGGLGIEPEVFDHSGKQQFAPIIPVVTTRKPIDPGVGRGKQLDRMG